MHVCISVDVLYSCTDLLNVFSILNHLNNSGKGVGDEDRHLNLYAFMFYTITEDVHNTYF